MLVTALAGQPANPGLPGNARMRVSVETGDGPNQKHHIGLTILSFFFKYRQNAVVTFMFVN